MKKRIAKKKRKLAKLTFHNLKHPTACITTTSQTINNTDMNESVKKLMEIFINNERKIRSKEFINK